MSKTEHPFTAFSQALAEAGLAKGSEKISLGNRVVGATPPGAAQDSVKAVPQAPQSTRKPMKLPRVLIEEAARIVYTHFEAIAAKNQGVTPLPWADLEEGYRREWRHIIAVVLEMGVDLVFRDAIQVLDQSNGDLGGAFAKGLRRYMKEYLENE